MNGAIFLFLLLFALIGAFLAGGFTAEHSVRSEAVDHGKAEYLITEKGTKIWRWKP